MRNIHAMQGQERKLLMMRLSCSFCHAGALGAYLWKNRGMQRNADQVVLIAGAALIAIAWGARSDSFVDNVGE